MSYDPSAPGVKGSVFGLPYNEEEASVIILPVPWDLTTSYSSGTSTGPQAILDASPQLDLELFDIHEAWKIPIWMTPISEEILQENNHLRPEIERYLDRLENQPNLAAGFSNLLSKVNEASLNLKKQIKESATRHLNNGKIVCVLGGDHSTPLGLIEALAEEHDEFGILQIDAHMDLRKSYEGFEQSHASIMNNAMLIPQITKLVQVGIRDYCPEELAYVRNANGRIKVFYDEALKAEQFSGSSWDRICQSIINELPDKVYISFDIDGLNPHLCPGTGTPVPGGLEFQEVMNLIKMLARSNKKIIAFDLCEVSPKINDNEWNANVGARMLYNLCCWSVVNRG